MIDERTKARRLFFRGARIKLVPTPMPPENHAMPDPAPVDKKAVLTRAQSFRLHGWLQQHAASCPTMTRHEAAAAASLALGFSISQITIRKIIKDAELNIVFKKQPRNGSDDPKNKDRRTFTYLRRLIEHLYTELGVPLPPNTEDDQA
jgi:hypothetical protein